jgi:hypothetical protein
VTAPEFFLLSIAHSKDTLLWWGPNRSGYTTNLDDAGRYSEADARATAHGRNHTVIAIRCEDALARSRRRVTVSSDDLFDLRVGARVCMVDGCSGNVDAPGGTCAACAEGAKGPSHISKEGGGQTWCELSIQGSRTYKDRHPIAWWSDRDSATCEACKVAEAAARELFERHHFHGCEFPYCEGCKEPLPK